MKKLLLSLLVTLAGLPALAQQPTLDAAVAAYQRGDLTQARSAFRQLSAKGTVHSPVGKDPQAYGVTLQPLPPVAFAKNDIGFIDPTGVDHDALGVGLKKAIYNYMHGVGLEQDVRLWWDMPVPKTRVARRYVERALAGTE